MIKYLLTLLLFFVTVCSYAQELAKILDQETIYIIKGPDEVEVTENYSIQINSEKGDQYGIYYDYFDKFRTIKDVKIQIKDLNGKKIKKLSKNDGLEIGYSPSNEITDSKKLIIDPKYKSYPYIIEVNSTVRLKGFISLPPWIPRPYFNLSVDRSFFRIEYPNQLEVKFREENIVALAEGAEGGFRFKNYEVKNLTHIDRNIYYKEFYEQQPKVMVSPLKFEIDNTTGGTTSWQEFGNWYYTLNDQVYELTDKTKAYLDNLDKSEKRKLIKDIYTYMQDKTRYISIQLGIGGFKSIPTAEVEATGYGDCKALSTYMKNMLDYSGIKSNYILVRAGEDVPDVMDDFPSNQFNHVFIGVPLEQDTIYLECTSQILPYNYVGTFTDDRNVLWIEENNSTIIRSKVYSQNENLQENKAIIKLDGNGNGEIQLKMKNEGTFFSDIMLYKSAPQDYIQRYNNNKFPYKDLTIKDFSFDQPERDIPVFTTYFQIEVIGIGRKVSEKLLLPANLLLPIDEYVSFNEFYQYGEVLRGITVKDEVEINIKDNFWAQKLPDEVNLSSKYGTYRSKVEVYSDKIVIKREMQFFKGTYVQEEFRPFLDFIKEIKKIERKNIVLNSRT